MRLLKNVTVRITIIVLVLSACNCVSGQAIFMPHMLLRGPNDCHRRVYVIPKITSIDSKSDSLKMEFILFGLDRDTMKMYSIVGMRAWKGFTRKNELQGDSVVLNITLDKPLDTISFPEKPQGYKDVIVKKDRPTARLVDKYSDYVFSIRVAESCYHGSWDYDSRYADKDYRWLFNKAGVYDPGFQASYTTFARKDFIEIHLKERKLVTKESFKVIDGTGVEVPFEPVTKINPTNTIALTLNRDLKAFEKFTLLVSDAILQDKPHESYFKFPMNVGSKSTVGLTGRYAFLEQ